MLNNQPGFCGTPSRQVRLVRCGHRWIGALLTLTIELRRLPMDLNVHPVARLFELPPARRARLKENIRLGRCVATVVLWNGQLIHGRHHAEICEELGLEVPTTTFT